MQRDSYLSVLAAILLGVLTVLCILLWIASDYAIFFMVWGVLVLLTAWAIWYYRRSYVSFELYEFTYSELGDGIETTLYAAIDSYVFTYDGFASTLKITTINDETFCLNLAVQDCRYLCSMLAVRGVRDRREELNEYLNTYARDWSLERMPATDRVVLLIGAWELLFNDDIPDAVAISEATGLARVLSTNDSPKFVNGLLDKLRRVKPTLLA